VTQAKKITTTAVLVAAATTLHIIESFIPVPIPIPGVKLGLANIVTLLTLVLFDFKTGMQIVILRILIGSLLSGTFLATGFFLSLSGALAATCIMAFLFYFFSGLSVIGISIAGAATHNLGQLAAAALIVEHTGIFFYLPLLLISSIPTGLITGLILHFLIKHLKGIEQVEKLAG